MLDYGAAEEASEAIDIIIVALVLFFAFLGIKRVKNSIKHGTCACCSEKCECEKKNAELQKGYEEWLKKKNEKKQSAFVYVDTSFGICNYILLFTNVRDSTCV